MDDGSEADLRRSLELSQNSLKLEKRKNESLRQDLRTVKTQALIAQKELEEEEEAILNRLMKRIDALHQEKAGLELELDAAKRTEARASGSGAEAAAAQPSASPRAPSSPSRTPAPLFPPAAPAPPDLVARLRSVEIEKAALQRQLEAEQAQALGRLERRVAELAGERAKLGQYKVDLENQLEQEQESMVNKLQKRVDCYAAQKRRLAEEKADLQRQVAGLTEQVSKLACEKVVMENQLEQEEEGIVNRLQRQMEDLMHRNKVLEARAERRRRRAGTPPTPTRGGAAGGGRSVSVSISESESLSATTTDDEDVYHYHHHHGYHHHHRPSGARRPSSQGAAQGHAAHQAKEGA